MNSNMHLSQFRKLEIKKQAPAFLALVRTLPGYVIAGLLWVKRERETERRRYTQRRERDTHTEEGGGRLLSTRYHSKVKRTA